MINTLLAKKLKMGHTYIQGARIAVTRMEVGPCIVTQIKDENKNGYFAVQLGFGTKKIKNISKPMLGHLKAAYKEDKKAASNLYEVRLNKKSDMNVGDTVKLSDVFKKGDVVMVTGTSKGKGFAGGVKRWGFAGGPKTHGQSDRLRAPGSIGQGTTPGRVHKGKKMAGRMGGETKTIKNLHVVEIDEEHNILAVSGPVPGSPNGILKLTKTGSGKLSELLHETPKVEVSEETSGETAQEEKKEDQKDA
jgi:large subunit ribosomal protein L3